MNISTLLTLRRKGRASARILPMMIWRLGLLVVCCASRLQVEAHGPPDILWRSNGNTERVRSVAFNADSTLVAVAGGYLRDTRVLVFRTVDGSLLKTLTNTVSPVESVVFSPDGRTLAATGGLQAQLPPPDFRGYSLINLWDTADWAWRGITNFTPASPVQVVFSHSGEYLAVAHGVCGECYGDLALFAVPSGGLVNRYAQYITGYSSLAFSRDDRELATSYFAALGTQIRNTTNGVVRVELEASGPVTFSPDGTALMVADSPGIRLFNAATGAALANMLEPAGVYSAGFTPDGKAIVSWARDDKIRFWSLRDYSVFQVYDQETTGVRALAVSPNGRYFAYGRDDGVVVLAQMPLRITDITCTGNQVRLTWSGGSGLYQLLRTTNLTSGQWANVGAPTIGTSATVSVTSNLEFFRVQNLYLP